MARDQPFTPEEHERVVASWEEDARILQVVIDEANADAEFLRKQGHDFPAEVMEHHARKAQVQLDEARELLESDGD